MIHYLDRSDELSLSLTCHRLRDIAQSLIFRSIETYPFQRVCELRHMGIEAYIQRSRERITILGAERVASFVHTFTLLDYPIDHYFQPPFRSHESHKHPFKGLLNDWFLTLPKFQNLDKLVCRGVQISADHRRILESIDFSELDLEFTTLNIISDVVDDVPMLMTCRRRLRFDRLLERFAKVAKPIRPPRFKFAESLEEIIAGTEVTDVILRALRSSDIPFLRLRHLQVDASLSAYSKSFIAALRNCPHLTSIHLAFSTSRFRSENETMLREIPANVVPELNTYQGPISFLPSVARFHNIRTVKICSQHPGCLYPTLTAETASMLKIFTPEITHLQMAANLIDMQFFNTLRTFASLEYLGINDLAAFHPPEAARTQSNTTFASFRFPLSELVLPGNLQTLRLGFPKWRDEEAFVASTAQQLRSFPTHYSIATRSGPTDHIHQHRSTLFVSDVVWTRRGMAGWSCTVEHRLKRDEFFGERPKSWQPKGLRGYLHAGKRRTWHGGG